MWTARRGQGITGPHHSLSKAQCLNLREVVLEPVGAADETRFQTLMEAHHYLGALPKIGHTLWYVASWSGQWLALAEKSVRQDVAQQRVRSALRYCF